MVLVTEKEPQPTGRAPDVSNARRRPHTGVGTGGKGVEGVYQRAISRISMGRSTLGAFRSTPLGIIAAESGHFLARARLNYRQARFAQRLHARPRNGEGPEEILTREGAALATGLRAAASLLPGDTAETQEWGTRRTFPG